MTTLQDSIQDTIFHNRQPDTKKLAAYGFKQTGTTWHYQTALVPGFSLTVNINGETITSPVTDQESGDLYTLHLDPANSGMFIGQIRGAYIAALTAISKDCFVPTMFDAGQIKKITAAIDETFAEQPEYLWKQFPNNAIIRRQDNRKWYALMVKVTPDKVGLTGADLIDLLVLRANPQTIQAQLKNGQALPAYHMNKEHWLSYQLDVGTPLETLMAAVKTSRELAK
ncbi:MmcQ/YjbR family DNA-binding protein [Lacticaseibacillus jixianensis]|uniref:MmcQ/YjbR family DNA-binding protein n=1 Tax=Lacticaseibacillus jixianensis TaxID=2486012 RepID=A0ABW4B9W6_9LACO|nr:MmcQ/YjbR family DNA-binding protein [Lacticaseibacillus jixianensis]